MSLPLGAPLATGPQPLYPLVPWHRPADLHHVHSREIELSGYPGELLVTEERVRGLLC